MYIVRSGYRTWSRHCFPN